MRQHRCVQSQMHMMYSWRFRHLSNLPRARTIDHSLDTQRTLACSNNIPPKYKGYLRCTRRYRYSLHQEYSLLCTLRERGRERDRVEIGA